MGDIAPVRVHATAEFAKEHLFCISGWAAWTPGRDTETSWRDWAGCQRTAPQGTGAELGAMPVWFMNPEPTPSLLRRRVSALGQSALRAAWGLPQVRDARLILASRHGEFHRTLAILDSLAAGQDVSPADFTLSVHNALTGLLSIATQNPQGHTAIAAGKASFGLGFVEALACLIERPSQPVVLFFFDEGLPPPFASFNDHDDADGDRPLALALALAPASTTGETFGLTALPHGRGAGGPAQPMDFLRFLLSGAAELSSRGENLNWQWRRHAAAA